MFQSLEDKIKQMDVAELLDESCAVDEVAAAPEPVQGIGASVPGADVSPEMGPAAV